MLFSRRIRFLNAMSGLLREPVATTSQLIELYHSIYNLKTNRIIQFTTTFIYK